MERLLGVDDSNYRFESLCYFYLSWTDPRAYPAIVESTTAVANGTKECALPCSSVGNDITCCDSVWLPSLDLVNVYSLPEDRLNPYGIGAFPPEANGTGGGVFWYSAVQATYFSPMSFAAFPFDLQHLEIQLAADLVAGAAIRRFVPSATSTRFIVRGDGDSVSGWDPLSVQIVPLKEPAAEFFRYWFDNYGTPSAPTDPMPLAPLGSSTIVDDIVDSTGSEQYRIGFEVVLNVKRFPN